MNQKIKNIKRTITIVAIIAALAITVTVCVIFIRTPKPTVLSDLVGESLPLYKSTDVVYEFSDADLSDDFSKAFLSKASAQILSISEDGKTATVKFCVPDLQKIMTAHFPTDEDGDFEKLFEEYYASVNAAIAAADESDMLTETTQCPVVSDGSAEKISIAGTPLLNYKQMLAEILIEIMNGGESE